MTPEEELASLKRYKESGRLRDVDILCAEGVDRVSLVRDVEREVGSVSDIDFGMGDNIVFSESGVVLLHHSKSFDVDFQIFEPVYVSVGGIGIPVVRPQTLYHLMRLSHGVFIREKDKVRARSISNVYESYPLPFSEDLYDVFGQFQNAKRSYPLTRLILSLDERRANSRKSPLRWVKEYVPGAEKGTHFLRRKLFELENKLM